MTRVISLSDNAYEELKRLKKGGESFSDVIIKITAKERKPLTAFFGKWPDPKELNRIEKDLDKERKKAKLRDVEF
ncbi:MAG: antitoxin VapB family protein [Candidatus Aenigmarchaeota archaeon]|nr:antitoxin VapB family protein [Candidatus Aenigmarchaeota archaeon]